MLARGTIEDALGQNLEFTLPDVADPHLNRILRNWNSSPNKQVPVTFKVTGNESRARAIREGVKVKGGKPQAVVASTPGASQETSLGAKLRGALQPEAAVSAETLREHWKQSLGGTRVAGAPPKRVVGRRFLGICERLPQGRLPGRVRVISALKTCSQTRRPVPDTDFDLDDLGPSGKVMWPFFEPPPDASLLAQILLFGVEENPKYHGTQDDSKDWYQVAMNQASRTWDARIAGAWLLSVPTRPSPGSAPPALINYRTGSRLYCSVGGELIGPWIVTEKDYRRVLLPVSPQSPIYSLPVEAIEPQALLDVGDQEVWFEPQHLSATVYQPAAPAPQTTGQEVARRLVGLCESTAAPERIGRIEVLGSLLPGARLQLNPNFSIEAVIGPSRRVLWPAASPYATEDFRDCIVAFSVESNPADFGIKEMGRRWYQVARKADDSGWDLQKVGAWLVPVVEMPSRGSEISGIQRVPPGSRVYCQLKQELIGPWLVRASQDQKVLDVDPKNPWVFALPADRVDPGQMLEIDDDRYWLVPDTTGGTVLDLAEPAEMVDWLELHLENQAADVLQAVASARPNWKAALTHTWREFSEPVRQQVYAARWRRLEPVLEALLGNSDTFVRLLDSSSSLQALYQKNLANLLDHERVRAYQEAETEAKELLESEKAELRGLREQISAERSKLETLRREGRLPGAPRRPAAVPARYPSADAFVSSRLWPALSRWMPGIAPQAARALHLAVLGCPWLLVGSALWTRAYHEAVGEDDSSFYLLTASPLWLTAEEPWKAGLAVAYEQARRVPDRLVLVHVEDLDRGLVQSWARPYLNLHGGLCESLVVPPMEHWPENLRLLWSLAADPAALPVPDDLWHGCGAVSARLKAKDGEVAGGFAEAGLELGQWMEWSSFEDRLDTPPDPRAQGLERFARLASQDLAHLEHVARRLGWEAEARRVPELIRLEWPKEFA